MVKEFKNLQITFRELGLENYPGAYLELGRQLKFI
jgi:hypothetical protein